MPRESIGEFEQLVLLAILRLGDRAYGIPILEEIRGRTGRSVLRPAVYVALRRLEDGATYPVEISRSLRDLAQRLDTCSPGFKIAGLGP